MAVDLSNVELPPFEVEITNNTLIRVCVAVVVTAVMIILFSRAAKRI